MTFKDKVLRQLHLKPPPLPLSPEVRLRLNRLFPPNARGRAEQLLSEEMGNNLFFGPFFTKKSLLTPEAPGIEQVRFAVLKLSEGSIGEFQRLIESADGDVVDLISKAGLGTQTWKQWMPEQQRWK